MRRAISETRRFARRGILAAAAGLFSGAGVTWAVAATGPVTTTTVLAALGALLSFRLVVRYLATDWQWHPSSPGLVRRTIRAGGGVARSLLKRPTRVLPFVALTFLFATVIGVSLAFPNKAWAVLPAIILPSFASLCRRLAEDVRDDLESDARADPRDVGGPPREDT